MSQRREEFERQFSRFALRAMGWSFMVAAVVAAFRFGPNLSTFAFAALGLWAVLYEPANHVPR